MCNSQEREGMFDTRSEEKQKGLGDRKTTDGI